MKKTQPTYKRQRFLLAFICQIDGGIASADLQKLMFLHTMKENSGFYEFLPYKSGAYSFQLAKDLDILCKNKYISIEDSQIKTAGEYTQESFYDLNIDKERGDDLVRKAYRAYPYYTINSEIIPRLFPAEEAQSFFAERQKYKQSGQLLFTIGYEGKTIEAFFNMLIQNGINVVCDVRKNPFSRKFGFSKSNLEHIAKTFKIEYVHIPELGIETAKRNMLETPEDYDALFFDYAETLPYFEIQLEWIYTLLRSNTRIALMCYEKDPNMCHRHIVKDYIVKSHGVRSEDL